MDGLRKERKKLYWNSLDEQLVVKTMMFKATVNPGRNDRFGAMRYDPEFLKECLRITQQIPVWGPDDGVPVLALHGWQDNAGSFDTLAPLLPSNIRLVCLDFCGHGLSSHYAPGMFLNYYDHVYHVKLVIDYFKWKKVNILGHSMGAITAIFFVSMYSELVDKLISLDAVKQLSSSAEYLPARMKGVLTNFQEIVERLQQGPLSSVSYEDARERVVKNYGGSIDEKDADVLLKRGLRKLSDEDEYEFTRDLRSTWLVVSYVRFCL
ncbi:serine hydrolase-like protein [Daphnia pulicaria]|uniref:serine hydrolase-like protein n=1 Tax=Daphnia pulicaria TaxID=35523 RepID=UPI001EEB5E33|nr:serine hydrolase-like protein [Daphnia pulicaria]